MRLAANKYGAKRTTRLGKTFDSKMEAEYYQILLLRLRAGQISDLTLQPEFTLLESFKRNGKTVRGVKYKADFMYQENGKTIVVDVKGYKTKDFMIKSKFFISQNPDKALMLVTQERSKWIERYVG